MVPLDLWISEFWIVNLWKFDSMSVTKMSSKTCGLQLQSPLGRLLTWNGLFFFMSKLYIFPFVNVSMFSLAYARQLSWPLIILYVLALTHTQNSMHFVMILLLGCFLHDEDWWWHDALLWCNHYFSFMVYLLVIKWEEAYYTNQGLMLKVWNSYLISSLAFL